MEDRFSVKMRVNVFEKPHQVTGFVEQYLKVCFLNHSKWNQNYYNNFVIEAILQNKYEKDIKLDLRIE